MSIEINLDLTENIKIFEQKTNIRFNEFYNKYFNKLVFHNYKICKNTEESEDLAQESIMRALSLIDTYDNTRASFSTWLFIISKNDTLQKIKVNKDLISLHQIIDDEGSTLLDYIQTNEDVDKDELLTKELNHEKGKLLYKCLPDLKTPYRNVLEMREIKKYSYRKISIEMKHKSLLKVNIKNYTTNHPYIDILLVDPEDKKDNELPKICDIFEIYDTDNNNVNYEIIEYDKDLLISTIRLYTTKDVSLLVNIPLNLSTVKSQIRNGRAMLEKIVKTEFKKLDKKYLG